MMKRMIKLPMPRATSLSLWLLLWQANGCRADFVDERPQSQRGAAGAPAEAPQDLRGADFVGVPFGPLASGSFGGRAGHLAVGDASLFRGDEGRVELRFDSLFEVSQVPGPVVVLTSRESIGTTIDSGLGDLQLGPLSSYSGEQSYPVRDPGDRRYAFVFCLSYGLEVARARMDASR